jgi:hypothetical protein
VGGALPFGECGGIKEWQRKRGNVRGALPFGDERQEESNYMRIMSWVTSTPIFPGLHAAPIQEIVQRLPVVVHLIAIMNDVENSADETARQQQEKRCPHF